VGAGDQEIHGLTFASANEPQQSGGEHFQSDALDNDQSQGHEGVQGFVLVEDMFDPAAEEVEDQKKVCEHENGVYTQFREERFQRRSFVGPTRHAIPATSCVSSL
jgi:hypothetical protein